LSDHCCFVAPGCMRKVRPHRSSRPRLSPRPEEYIGVWEEWEQATGGELRGRRRTASGNPLHNRWPRARVAFYAPKVDVPPARRHRRPLASLHPQVDFQEAGRRFFDMCVRRCRQPSATARFMIHRLRSSESSRAGSGPAPRAYPAPCPPGWTPGPGAGLPCARRPTTPNAVRLADRLRGERVPRRGGRGRTKALGPDPKRAHVGEGGPTCSSSGNDDRGQGGDRWGVERRGQRHAGGARRSRRRLVARLGGRRGRGPAQRGTRAPRPRTGS